MVDGEFVEFLKEMVDPLGGISMRKMFGGLSIYRDGLIFGLVAEGTLYLKADAAFVPAFEAEECGPFTYTDKSGRSSSMPYWRLPERLYDEPDEFVEWCRRSIDASRRIEAARGDKPVRKRRGKGD